MPDQLIPVFVMPDARRSTTAAPAEAQHEILAHALRLTCTGEDAAQLAMQVLASQAVAYADAVKATQLQLARPGATPEQAILNERNAADTALACLLMSLRRIACPDLRSSAQRDDDEALRAAARSEFGRPGLRAPVPNPDSEDAA